MDYVLALLSTGAALVIAIMGPRETMPMAAAVVGFGCCTLLVMVVCGLRK